MEEGRRTYGSCHWGLLGAVLSFFLALTAGQASGKEQGGVVSAQTGSVMVSSPSGSGAVLSAPTPTSAGSVASQPTGTTAPAVQETNDTLVDIVHAELSGAIQGTATYMDSFFGNWRYAREVNESYVRFGYNVLVEEGSPLYRKPDMQVRIVLPQLRKKTRLELSGAPKEAQNFSVTNESSQKEPLPGSTEERNASLALHQTFFESAQQSFVIRTGARLHNLRPVVTFGPRYRVLFPLGEWSLRFTQELVWTSNSGWDSGTVFDLERPLSKTLFFRASNSWIGKEHVPGFIYAYTFSLGQALSSRRALQYEWVNVCQTQPVHELTEVDLRIRYRQRLWRDWFFFELTPQERFPRSRSFKATPGILFRLEMFLGNYAHFK